MRQFGIAACTLALASGFVSVSVAAPQVANKADFDLQGHRGARGLSPENTLAGFTRALDVGVTTLELDCGVTKDGVVVVSHDRLLNSNHTRDASGQFLSVDGPAIVDLTYEELRQFDVGRIRPGSEYAAAFPEQVPVDGERMPRLSDVFALVARIGNRDVRFNIETKVDPAHPEQTVSPLAFARALEAVIRESGMVSRVTVQSFDWRTLRLLGTLAPDIALVALTDQQKGEDTVEIGKPGPSPWLGELDVDDHDGSVPKLVQALGAKTWSPHALDLTPALVIEAHSLGLAVVPWTVNDPLAMERVIGLGVDGLITDYPDRLRTVMHAKGIALPAPTPAR